MRIQYLSDVEQFIESLEETQVGKIAKAIELLEEFGNTLGMPHSKPLGRGLFELRLLGEDSVRIFYIFHRDSALLIHVFKKKTRAIPTRELSIARKKMALLASL